MANKYLSITFRGQEYNIGFRNKLGIHPTTKKLVAPVKNEKGKLALPSVKQEGKFIPLDKTNTSYNTVLALKGNGEGPALSFNKESAKSIDEGLSDLVPEGFSIDLNSAVLLLNQRLPNSSSSKKTKRSSKSNGERVLGASFGAAIDFSKLPFLEKIIPPGYELGINNFQMILASVPFTREETFALKHIVPPGTISLPTVLNKGANIAIEMQLGGQPITLDMNMFQPPALPDIPDTQGETPRAINTSAGGKTPKPSKTKKGASSAVNRPVGGVNVDSISLGYENQRLQLLVDGTISAMGLSLGFMGLAVTIPLEDVTKPRFDRIRLSLDGLILNYEKGFLSLSGMFLRLSIKDEEGKDTGRYEYIGQIAIKTQTFGITGIGCYTELPGGGSSAFVYASLLTPLGGDPAFFIEGIALGMGYNRGIERIPVEDVNKFPLVTALYSSMDGPPSITYVKNQFRLLSKYIPAVKGQYMMAVGLKVSTYKLVNSIAVLMVEFGERLSIQIVGTSSMQLPPSSTGLPALGNIELAFRVVFDPDQGLLGIDGILTENSFLLTPDCRLSGGFAFYTWFIGPHAGDFVVTVGGYHPKFNVPSHYPKPARIQFGFDMGLVRFKGQLYAALTSSAIMAGGRFEAFYGVGNISAQFNVALDFIISWLPFFYDARFSVSVSMKVSLWLFDLKASIGTDLHIWGPEFAGYAKVDLKIHTARFDFGAARQLKKAPVSWTELNSTFLPEQADILKTHLTQGLISEKMDGDTLWHILEPDQFELKIESQLPVNQINCDTMPKWEKGNAYLKGNQVKYSLQVYQAKQDITANTDWNLENWERLDNLTGDSFSIAPMGGKKVSNWTLNVNCSKSPDGMQFEVIPENKPMPLALWGDSMDPDIKGPTKKSLLSGAIVRSLASQPPGTTEAVDADEFKFQDVVENDPYWQWEDEYTVASGNTPETWVSKTTYKEGHCVEHNGTIYRCIVGTSSTTNFTPSSWRHFDSVLEYQKEAIQTDITEMSQRDTVAHFFGYQNERMDVQRMATDLDAAFIGTPQIMQKAS
jgi:hypothetical protein